MSEKAQEEVKKERKWPKEYYATKRECLLEFFRHAKIKDAKRRGFVAWRKKDHGPLA